MKTAASLEVLFAIDRSIPIPLHVQLAHDMRTAIRSGRLKAGLALASTRSMAESLGVARGIVVQAYEQLVYEGYLVARTGSGTSVAELPAQRPSESSAVLAPPLARFDFLPGRPDKASFPKAEWLTSVRSAMASAPATLFDYPDPSGPFSTRTALVNYLSRARATSAMEDRVVLCSGFTQGISLVARLLAERGITAVALEDPASDTLVRLFASLRIATVRIPVDSQGLDIGRLAASAAEAVVVTPAHQYPLGVGMAPERRSELLRWVNRDRRFIVEDDYDAEFRFDRQPVGTLQGLAPDRVIYIGTASKVLSPALRLGWMLMPSELVESARRLKLQADRGSPTIDQLALGHFLACGALDHHLRRMRLLYKGRRGAMIAALAKHLPEATIHGLAAGLHAMVTLPVGTDENKLVRIASEHSLALFGTQALWSAPQCHPSGLVMGYGSVTESLIPDGVRLLRSLLPSAQA